MPLPPLQRLDHVTQRTFRRLYSTASQTVLRKTGPILIPSKVTTRRTFHRTANLPEDIRSWRTDDNLRQELEKIIKRGDLNDLDNLPSKLRDEFEPEQLRRAIEGFHARQFEAEKQSAADLFLTNLHEIELQAKMYEEDDDNAKIDKEIQQELNSYPRIPVWLGLLLLLFFATGVVARDQENSQRNPSKPPADTMWSESTVQRISYFPTRLFSQWWGYLTGIAFPSKIQFLINWAYAMGTGCNLQEAERGLEAYPTLKSFFQRNLRAGVRPIDQNSILVSPVDGVVVQYGFVNEDDATIEQVKGVSYSLKSFLGEDSPVFERIKELRKAHLDKADPNYNKELYYCVLYLAPSDYHAYHAPADIRFSERIHYPGHLFPVASWAVKSIRNLFPLNERVVLSGSWEHGYFSYSPVGAYNVGSIELGFEPELVTNLPTQSAHSAPIRKLYQTPIDISRGDRVGFFNLGSSVVMVFEAPSLLFEVPIGTRVKLGQPLAQVITPELAKSQLEVIHKHQEYLARQRQQEESIRKKNLRTHQYVNKSIETFK